MNGDRVVLWDKYLATLRRSTRAELYCNTTAILRDDAAAMAYDNSRVVLYDYSSCVVCSRGVEVWLHDHSIAFLTKYADLQKIHKVSGSARIKVERKLGGRKGGN